MLQLFQQLERDEFVHVVAENCCTADPLSINFAPAEFCPARIGYAHVQFVFLHLLPVFGSDDMAQWMGKIMPSIWACQWCRK